MLIIQNRMNKGKKRIFSLVALFTITIVTFAQQVGSNSPYGRYGYGSLSNPSTGASEAMGGISYGLRRSQQVNPGNPASYSKLDTLTFVFDIGVSGHYAKYNDGIASQNFYNGNLDYVAMQFPLLRNMGASIGLLPYSKVGYNYGRGQTTTDLVYQEIYNGSGGLSQIYGGLAWAPVKYVSVGMNMGYFFGKIQHTRQLPYINNTTLARSSTNTFSIRDIKYDFGVQFTYPIDKERSFTLGAVYTPQIKSKATVYPYDRLIDPNSGQIVQVLQTDTLASQSFQFPHTFGLGATYSNANLLVGIDGTYQLWKNLDYPTSLDGMSNDNRYNNRYRINAGAEYTIDPYSRNFFQRIRFRGGFSFANSYNNVYIYNDNSTPDTGGFKEYGVNIGFGLPFRSDTYTGKVSMVNIGLGYSLLQPDKSYMIKEEVFKITLNMNINEFWFFKRQFD